MLTEAEGLFVEHYVLTGGDIRASAAQAGFSPNHGYKLLRKPSVKAAILEEQADFEVRNLPRHYQQLEALSRHSKADVALKATLALVERASPLVRRSEITHKHELAELSIEELDARLVALFAEMPAEDRSRIVDGGKLLPVPRPSPAVIDAEAVEVPADSTPHEVETMLAALEADLQNTDEQDGPGDD